MFIGKSLPPLNKLNMPFTELKPRCPYCEAEWNEDMFDVDAFCSFEDTGFVNQDDISLEIKCHSCERLIYKK